MLNAYTGVVGGRGGHLLNSGTGSFLKSFPNLKECPGAMCFKKNQKDFFSF